MTTEDKARFLDACPHLLDDVQDNRQGSSADEVSLDWPATWDEIAAIIEPRGAAGRQRSKKLFRSVFTQRDLGRRPFPTTVHESRVSKPMPTFATSRTCRSRTTWMDYFEREVLPHVARRLDGSKQGKGWATRSTSTGTSTSSRHRAACMRLTRICEMRRRRCCGFSTRSRRDLPTKKLKYLVDPSRPITYGIVQCGPFVPGGVPYIRPADMSDEGGIATPELLRTSPEIAAAYKRSEVEAGDLIVSIGPSFGKVMIVPATLTGGRI